jgi:ABC-type ATPase with predicted acetyltransferase domain
MADNERLVTEVLGCGHCTRVYGQRLLAIDDFAHVRTARSFNFALLQQHYPSQKLVIIVWCHEICGQQPSTGKIWA